MQQDVSRIIVWDRREAPRSIMDILELSGSVSEAAQTYKRHYHGGRWAGVNSDYFETIQAGYIQPDGQAFYPFGYSPL